MTPLEIAVNEFNRISKLMGYVINPPYTGKPLKYDFGRGIPPEQPVFWQQYNDMLHMSNGLFADGHVFYGLKSDNEAHDLLEFNQTLNTPGLENKLMTGKIVIGHNNLDIFYYDVFIDRWVTCDRIGVDRIIESCNTLAELIDTQIAMLKASNSDIC